MDKLGRLDTIDDAIVRDRAPKWCHSRPRGRGGARSDLRRWAPEREWQPCPATNRGVVYGEAQGVSQGLEIWFDNLVVLTGSSHENRPPGRGKPSGRLAGQDASGRVSQPSGCDTLLYRPLPPLDG